MKQPDPRPPLLLTRPATGSARFAAQFRARFGADWPVVIAPLTDIVPTGAPVPDMATPIFTSENAVAAAGPGAGRLAWCVGAQTAARARAAGFAVAEGTGDAAGLAHRIIADRPDGALVHLRGAEVAFPVAEVLNRAGLRASEVVVYAQRDLPLAPEARELLTGGAVVLAALFSPKGAARFAAAVPPGARIRVAAISPAAAIAAEACEIAPTPDAAGVLAALERLVAADQAG